MTEDEQTIERIEARRYLSATSKVASITSSITSKENSRP